MSSTQKLTGTLALGPVQYAREVAVYESMRVGAVYLKGVKVVGRLDTLLRNGEDCTLWLATIRTPTPFLFKREIFMIYAVEDSTGMVHQAIDEVRRDWTTSRILTFFVLFGVGVPTMLMFGLGLLFWINALRLPFATLPDQMRCD